MKKITLLNTFFLMCMANTSYSECESSVAPLYNIENCHEYTSQKPCTVFFLDGELVYWRPDQTGMTYALSVSDFGALLGSSNTELHQTSEWNPGFRLGAGWEQSCYDVGVYWTHFQQTARTTSSDPIIIGTQLLSPTSPFTIGGSGVGGGQPHSKWNLKFDVIELILGSQYKLSNNFLLRPYLGVIGGRIDQTQKINYDHFFDTNLTIFFDAEIQQKNDFCGIGPKFGFGGHYLMNCGLGLVGDIAGSFMYGNGKSPVTTIILNDPLSFPFPESEIKYKQRKIVPILQGKLGVTSCAYITHKLQVNLGILYEAQYLWGTWRYQNSSIQSIFLADAGYGNLMIQGLTLTLNIGY